MSEKIPRLKPHHMTMGDLAKLGADRYHPKPVLNPDQQRRIGQMSLTDGVPIIREAPGGVGWPE